jgi:hypothetical protein
MSQLLAKIGLPITEVALDGQVEQFPLITVVYIEDELNGFLFGSLERVGGTPCILWGLGASRKGRNARVVIESATGELARRAAISFPDEDVLVAGRIAHPGAYTLFGKLTEVVPRPSYSPTGEERAWGRRLARRFSCESRYDEKLFKVKKSGKPEPVLDASTINAGGAKAAAVVGTLNPAKGEALIAFGWATAESLAISHAR